MATSKIALLKTYLCKLPDALPVLPPDASAQRLLYFDIDPAWVADVGEAGAVNRALEGALHDYLPRNNQGLFFLKHRGPAIEKLADVFEIWLEKHPDDIILLNWLDSAVDSVKAVIALN